MYVFARNLNPTMVIKTHLRIKMENGTTNVVCTLWTGIMSVKKPIHLRHFFKTEWLRMKGHQAD